MRKNRPRRLLPQRTARNCFLFRSRSGPRPGGVDLSGLPSAGKVPDYGLGGEPLAAAIAASCDDATTAFGSHASTETMTALTDEFGWLVGTLHLFLYRGVRPFLVLSHCNRSLAGLASTQSETAPEARTERVRAYRKKVLRSQFARHSANEGLFCCQQVTAD